MKPMGKRIDNMILKYPIAMKCAFGENPKRRYMTSRMSTRMTNAALIREALQKAALYMAKKRPPVMTSPSCLLLIKNQNP